MPLMSDKRVSRLLLWAAFVLAVVVVVEIIAGIGAVCALADPSALPRYCLYFNALKDWQTFLAATLGFGGLIWVARQGYAGILLSTKHADDLAKRAAQLAVDRDEEQRSHELRALPRSLAAETAAVGDQASMFSGSLQTAISGKGVSKFGIDLGPLPAAVYSANTGRIGLLGEILAPIVVRFYGRLRATENQFEVCGRLPGETVPNDLVTGLALSLRAIAQQAQALSRLLTEFADDPDSTLTISAVLAWDDGTATG